MTRLGNASLLIVFLLALAGSVSLRADPPHPAPDFKEVYGLVRDHLAEKNDAELNSLAVQALLSALAPKVSLVGETPTEPDKEVALVTRTSLFDGPIAYVRVGRVGSGLDAAVRQAWQELAATNKLTGLVLDLRFAGGEDYGAAVSTADLFIKKEQPLLDWGQGLVRSKEKTDNIAAPLAVLVDQKTSEAAEALAAALREAGAGLILGNRTAGQAMISQEYPLSNGQRLRIATRPIQLGDGTSLSSEGLKPDITVPVSLADERAYFADAFREIPRPGSSANPGGGAANLVSGTNRLRRPRFNEAELVRERRDGAIPESDVAGTTGSDSEKPMVRDPVLARALDFLKGLSVVRQTRF